MSMRPPAHIKPRGHLHRSPKCAGQAMVEIVVGLLAMVVLIAGLLQISSLTRAQTDAMAAARQEVGTLLFGEHPVSALPDYIAAIGPGPDNRSYSYDDTSTSADPAAFQHVIMDQAVHDPADWDVLDTVPDNAFSALHDAAAPVNEFGLLKGDASETVSLIPAVRGLLYRADEIEVECDVWMTWTRGIY